MKAGGRVMRANGGSMDNKRDVRKVEQMIGGAVSSKREMGREKSTIPPRRFLKGTKKTQSGSTNFIRRTTDQTNLKEALKKAKKDNPGFNVRIMKPEDMPRRKVRMASGGRIGLRAGSKGCKLAMKGKGRAYGKNS